MCWGAGEIYKEDDKRNARFYLVQNCMEKALKKLVCIICSPRMSSTTVRVSQSIAGVSHVVGVHMVTSQQRFFMFKYKRLRQSSSSCVTKRVEGGGGGGGVGSIKRVLKRVAKSHFLKKTPTTAFIVFLTIPTHPHTPKNRLRPRVYPFLAL